MFLDLENRPCVGNSLWIPAMYSPLVTRAMCFRSAPLWAACLYVVVGLTSVEILGDVTGPWSDWLPDSALCGV